MRRRFFFLLFCLEGLMLSLPAQTKYFVTPEGSDAVGYAEIDVITY